MKALLLLIIPLIVAPSLAATYSYESYDEIVDQLSRYKDGSVRKSSRRYRPLHTKAHAGIGISQTFFQTSSSDGDQNGLEHGGLMLSLGMDIFSPQWSIEGSYQNFGRSRGPSTQYQLKEFNIKTFYKPQVADFWFLRVGGGISSRFLTVRDRNNQSEVDVNTPSLALTLGVDTFLTQMVSLGADFNFKNALITDTIDNQSVDLSIRIDTHF